MALTKTRTRTQTALTSLALLIANVHGELALVEKLLAGPEELPDAHLRGLAAKRAELQELRTDRALRLSAPIRPWPGPRRHRLRRRVAQEVWAWGREGGGEEVFEGTVGQ